MNTWLNTAVFYEIYPQSFQDSNGDGIGDFQGIIRRLDYIKELGCNALWLNPCFVSPFSDAGYDIADYFCVAPRYGTNADIKELFDEVHKRNMHIILDLVPGHTSIEHPWFKESMKAEINEYSGRYIWTDSIWDNMSDIKNITGCIRGISSRDGSCAINFFSSQPALNYGFARIDQPWQKSVDSPEAVATKEAMKDVIRFWLTMGCDGFRVDMAGSLVKNDEESLATIALWQEIRLFLDTEFPDAVMISEWGEPDKSLSGGFHMDFLLHFGPSHYLDLFRNENPYFSKEGKGDISQFVDHYKKYNSLTNGKGLICIPSGNHDMDRMARSLSQEEMKLAFAFLLSMPGAPFIYYGDEIGMRYIENLVSVEGGYGRTGSRSPMQWDNGVNAGFSAAPKDKLYIMQDESPNRPTVKAQMEAKDSLWQEVKKLISIRQAESALQADGTIKFIYAKENAYPLVYTRSSADSCILIVLNPSGQTAVCHIGTYTIENIIYSFGEKAQFENGSVTAPACSGTFFKLECR
ncbi:alpha-amylase family glycosyl hydrolase [Anaeromicropila populeti]|uniref:Maltose alpha-D-glucosyltransferase/ alpha-amylase n=1 Tax=Anaeromicropila populeti TaxID=37658 RepID=A0A1I6IWN7_9FIRM|nr:alpha-amylase family glycosyl hydrolase [Anaeromicropila populeti]SFR71155.1 maltose alpha-D-glucosyltransferase/ alpha-amylase [Anaeromicropila populeti]